jgi:pilus assembly protein Flp/PilA
MRFITDTLLRLYAWTKSETAQTMAEYGLILALISVAAVAVLLLLGPQIAAVFTNITQSLQDAIT